MNFIRFFVRQPIITIPSRGLKYKDVLQLRCDGCYFKNIDHRWFVFCTKAPRHKQAEKVARNKFNYIVSERSHVGYPAFKKRYQFPGQIL